MTQADSDIPPYNLGKGWYESRDSLDDLAMQEM